MRFLYMFLFWLPCSLFSQQSEIVDFIQADAVIEPDFQNKSISGKVTYTFKILKDVDSVFLDAHQVNITAESKSIQIKTSENKIWFLDAFRKDKTYVVSFEYQMIPKQTFYFMPGASEFWTQGQGKYTSHWFPSLDDTNDKIIFNMSYLLPKDVITIANGKLRQQQEVGNKTLWDFEMKQPMSSYLLAVAGGDYEKKVLKSKSDVPFELYFKPENSENVEATYRFSKEIFDFLEREVGVPYPWEIYKQVPVRDFLYAGMENTTATFFSEAFLVDDIGFNDRNYVNVNAHELAHQWFGNFVTAKTDKDHWLQEGFATYYALLAEREIFGEDYFYWQLLQNAEHLHQMSEDGKGESLLNPKAGSLTFYQKGAWALHILREKIGDEAFQEAMRNYLNKYQFSVSDTQNFLDEVRAVTPQKLDDFEQNWLLQTAFRAEEAYLSLKRSDFIRAYFEIAGLRADNLSSKKDTFKKALKEANDFIGQEVIYQLGTENLKDALPFYKIVLESENLMLRQAVALTMQEIPDEIFEDYYGLLDDKSYLTREIAFYNLWTNFPDKRLMFLDKMKDQIGFQNKNLRQLWLTLSVVTEGFMNKDKSIRELRSYTDTSFSFEIREPAFRYIQQLSVWDLYTLKDLIDSMQHPVWRFAKSSKELLQEIVDEEPIRSFIVSNLSDFSASERLILEKYLNE